MVVSLKANKKRILAFAILALIVVGACLFLGGTKPEKAQEIPGGTNEERVTFLQSFGWQVDAQPVETREVMIPEQFSDVYVTYNVMQQAQGFDLKPFAGATCTQYRYHITNYDGEPEVYATVLVHNALIIGGDVACAEVDGFMHGFAKDSARYGETGQSGTKDSGKSGGQDAAPAESAAPQESSEAGEPTPEPGAEKSKPAAAEAESDDFQETVPEEPANADVEEDAWPTD